MQLTLQKSFIKDYIYIILGAFVFAAAVNVFFEANHLVVGGVTGLGIIADTYAQMFWGRGLPLFLTNIVVNVPLFIAAYIIMGKHFLGRTVFATLFLSLALAVTQFLPAYQGDLILTAVYGGLLSGVGIGFVFRGMATTGGTDLAAALLHRYYRHVSVSKLIFVLDAAIIAVGLFVFGYERAMFAVIAVYISMKCMGAILDGTSYSKAALVISDHADDIAKELLKSVDRGVTAFRGKGMYTGNEKDVLLCAFSQKEITKLKETVMKIDPNAFVLVADVKEVLGEGFQSMN